ncbi:hypothetical protein [Streptomyces sp. NBC_01237]|uniref:hypothetical protein n=1 Tax=Streptomyces sp. NBC_01237 TaxID=2903790 RepID=UPI002DD7F311|nr:hypothetical protein [Streptomyces sp. NBC_01237]WRZ73092.1 hypothetical protein OG251_16455 [Streptomyces sp. NBC_01237]
MKGDFQFSWELTGSGWATCSISDVSSKHKHFVSYCTDALADVVHGVAGLYGPTRTQRISFDLEPGEVRWVLRGHGSNVDITIYRFPDMSASFDAPDEEGALCWSSTQPRSALGHAALEAAQVLLRRHGEKEYQAKWVRYPFPAAALQDLRRLHLRDDDCQLEHELALP